MYFDSDLPDEARRERLYQGQMFVFSPTPATLALRDFALEMITEAFALHDTAVRPRPDGVLVFQPEMN